MYKGEQVWLRTYDDKKIDAMLIHSKNSTDDEIINSYKTIVIFFNPNAGYYEYFHEFQIQWMNFYTDRGFAVMLWNYRGYGRSEGRPNSDCLLSDGETVIKYVREKYKPSKLVFHGESLGGAVAACLAEKCSCDLLFADRTFGRLDNVVGCFSRVAKAVFGLVTNWKLNCTNAYIQSSCYKVIGNDPNDNVVHELASLKASIALRFTFSYSTCIDNCYYILTQKELYDFFQILKHIQKMAQINQQNEDKVNEPEANAFKEKASARSFVILVNDEQADLLVQSLSNSVLVELVYLDAGGITLERIIKDTRKLHIDLLKTFMINLDIWGSHPFIKTEEVYQPLSNVIEERVRAQVIFYAYIRKEYVK